MAEYNVLWSSLRHNRQVHFEELGQMLIRLRIAMGITQKELAKRMGGAAPAGATR